MMERLGLDVIKVEVPWGEGVPEDKLEQILKEDTEKKIKAVTVVHNETTTGDATALNFKCSRAGQAME